MGAIGLRSRILFLLGSGFAIKRAKISPNGWDFGDFPHDFGRSACIVVDCPVLSALRFFYRHFPELMKTYSANPEKVKRDWFVVDADNKVLGRLASEIAHRLKGKHKPEYTPHVDTGDYIVVVNAEKVALTGNKENAKKYYRHTGYPGGIKETSFKEMIEKHPTRVIETAVKGMLPRNKLGRAMLSKLKIYAGEQHGHQAQQPNVLEI